MSSKLTTRIAEEIGSLFALKFEKFEQILKKGLSVVTAF